jgi:hypothetical protein
LTCEFRFALAAVFVGCLLAVWTPAAYAHTIALADANSTLIVDPHSQEGASEWTVDETSHLFQQWFWFRTSAGGFEASIDTLDAEPTETELDTQGLDLLYSGLGLDIGITYTLTGGTAGSGISYLAESIRIVNTGSTSLEVNFFQYSDFDIGGSEGDIVDLENSNQWRQFDPNVAVAETTSDATANRCWAAPFPTISDNLNDDTATTLPGDNSNTSDPNCGPLGPTDATWAWQWSFTLAPGGEFLISKDKLILPLAVPEPPTAALPLGIALLLLEPARRRASRLNG